MKTYEALILILSVFLLTSMSECKDHEGPNTMVNGTLSDEDTDEIYRGVTLIVERRKPVAFGAHFIDLDSAITDRDGGYRINFTPILPGTFTVGIKHSDLKKHGLKQSNESETYKELEVGKTNNINFKVKKLINLKLNLKNSSNHNLNAFRMNSGNCYCVNYSSYGTEVTKDTTLNFIVPRFSNMIITSTFHETGKTSFVKTDEINILGADTTIHINN